MTKLPLLEAHNERKEHFGGGGGENTNDAWGEEEDDDGNDDDGQLYCAFKNWYNGHVSTCIPPPSSF